MEHWSHEEASHPCPPYNDMDEAWADIPRQVLRSSRKVIGLAASADVNTLSLLLNQLRSLAEEHLSQRVDSAVVAYPRLHGFYHEDVEDTAEYLGMTLLQGHSSYPPRELVAAFAAHGMGLCQHFEDRERCYQEGLTLPTKYVLSVQCTETATLLEAHSMGKAHDHAYMDTPMSADFTNDHNS